MGKMSQKRQAPYGASRRSAPRAFDETSPVPDWRARNRGLPATTRGGLVNDERERYLRPQTSVPLRRVTAILAPPPRHPGAVAVGGRGGRVGLEAELLGRLGDAVDEEVLVLVIAVFAHDGAELGQLAVKDARDRIPLVHHDLVQPVGEQRDVGGERGGRARDVCARVHGREVEDVRGRDQDLGQEGVHGNPEDQRETAEPDPLPLRPRERGDRAGEQQGERAVPRVVGQGVVQERVVPQIVGDHPRPHHVHPDEASNVTLAGRGHDDLAQSRDRDDVEQARRGGQQVPIPTNRAEARLRVDTNVALGQVGGDLLVPLRRVQLSCDAARLSTTPEKAGFTSTRAG